MASGSENTLVMLHSSAGSMAPKQEGESPDVLESRLGMGAGFPLLRTWGSPHLEEPLAPIDSWFLNSVQV